MYKDKISEFLNNYAMSIEDVDDAIVTKEIFEEMESGLLGKRKSLSMIPTYLNPNINVIANKKVVVIDAGGSNFRSGVAYFDENNKCIVSDVVKTRMPGVEKELNAQDFFGEMANNVRHTLDKGTDVGFCFSFPVDMQSDMDGILLRCTKEVKAPEVVGMKIGANMLEALKKYSPLKRSIVIINDTVTTLLGGKAITLDGNYDSYLGFIYGTGINISYIEKTCNIKCSSKVSYNEMIINTEAGDFRGFVAGEFDKRANELTAEKNDFCFEKLSSGRYLPHIIYQAVLQAKADGLFVGDVEVNNEFTELALLSQLSQEGKDSKLAKYFSCESDIFCAKEIVLQLTKRAAKMSALVLSSVIKYATKGETNKKIALVAEGTTFNKLYSYKQMLKEFLTEMLAPSGIQLDIIQGEELNLVGTALASLATQ